MPIASMPIRPRPYLRLGTRGSRLALAQARLITEAITQQQPDLQVESIPITTTGDVIKDRPLYNIGGKALFCRELDTALLTGEVDFTVHSMKDVPTDLPSGIKIAAVLPRANPADVFIGTAPLEQLPKEAVIGTSSLRRQSQMLAQYPDLQIRLLRGNLPRRLASVGEDNMAGTFLAAAGLDRLGIKPSDFPQLSFTELPVDDYLPSAAQGTVGVLCLAEKVAAFPFLAAISHFETMQRTLAERALLAAIDGSCRTPVGVHATIKTGALTVKSWLALPDGTDTVTSEATGLISQGVTLGRNAGQELLAKASPALRKFIKEE